MAATLSVAVVIPAFNGARFLRRTLPILREAASGTRIVVVDAGSSDDTAEVARSLGTEVIRLPERAGPALARNVGVAHSEEDVILFLDADCAPHADVVERVRAAFESEPSFIRPTASRSHVAPAQRAPARPQIVHG